MFRNINRLEFGRQHVHRCWNYASRHVKSWFKFPQCTIFLYSILRKSDVSLKYQITEMLSTLQLLRLHRSYHIARNYCHQSLSNHRSGINIYTSNRMIHLSAGMLLFWIYNFILIQLIINWYSLNCRISVKVLLRFNLKNGMSRLVIVLHNLIIYAMYRVIKHR